jgi:transposase
VLLFRCDRPVRCRRKTGAFYARYRTDGWGAPAFHPVMMVKVLLFGYTNGTTSSRRLAAMLEVDIGFRYLAASGERAAAR